MRIVTGVSRRLRRVVLVVLAVALAGCQALLPRSTTRTLDGWKSFDDARESIGQIKPFETQRRDIHEQGLDPKANSAVTILSFSDLMQRFAASANLPPEEQDRGIHDCLRAGKRCTAYAVNIKRVEQHRVGNFWLDMLNFKHDTQITGWSYNALIVFVDDVVVFLLDAGQPRIRDQELFVNPLGPLQGIGEGLGSRLTR